MAKAGTKLTKEVSEPVVISPPNFKTVTFCIQGTAPYVQNAFSNKAKEMMMAVQRAGSTAKKGRGKREPKDFQECYERAKHISDDGWCGIPAPAFRNAMVSACRICGFQMTKAKLCVFVEADGYDANEGTPLVKITKGEPKYHDQAVRLETGVIDIRPRPMWGPGWEADLRIRFDADMFTTSDIANLLMRVGQQVGIGEGRPDSKKSCGQGWGLFQHVNGKKSK